MTRLCAFVLAAICMQPLHAQEAATTGTGAVLRGLDKVNGEVTDVTLSNGDSAKMGHLTLKLGECRYPDDDTARDAFAYLTIDDRTTDHTVFTGWMIATAPALNALEHARYDVWVLRCTTE